MKNTSKALVILSLVMSAGLAYTLLTLKNLPEIFDWDLEEEIDDEF
jgi:hypothetical protein